MTDQTYSSIEFRNKQYWLVQAVPFSPFDYGIGPYDISTANMLGFSGNFAVRQGMLFLNSLITTHDENHIGLLSLSQIASAEEEQQQAGSETLMHSEMAGIDHLFAPAPGTGKLVSPPQLNGQEPEKGFDRQWIYSDLNMPLDYTGTLSLLQIDSYDGSNQECRTAITEMSSTLEQTAWSLRCQHGRVTEVTSIDNAF